MGRRAFSGSFLTPVKNDGTVQTPTPGSGPSGGMGWFLLAAGTYYVPLPEDDCESSSMHVQWDSAIAATLTLEDSNFPVAKLPNSADGTVPTDGATTWWSPNTGVNLGEWVPEKPTTAYVGTTVATNVAVANGVVTITAGTQNAAMYHFADSGSKRARLAIVVTTQGAFRAAFHGKD